jgi:ectoine hydroxylase-related dioxygenase (phytanoyl-CoA dioxygenase family)
VSAADLAVVGTLLDSLFGRFDEFPDELAHDLGAPREAQKAQIAELEYVTTLAPALRRTQVVKVFTKIAAELLGGQVQLTYDHAIYKPSGSNKLTPWHQDSAHDPAGRRLATVWIPLQDTDASNGCMRYMPGSHLNGAIAHLDIPGRHGLVPSIDLDEAQAREAAVPAGGAVIHGENTFHSAGPNPSDEVRRALILQFTRQLTVHGRFSLALTRAHVRRLRFQTRRSENRVGV